MDKSEVLKIVSYISDELVKRKLDIKKVILFGSYENGIPREGSDIDVAVISDIFENKSIVERGKLLREIELSAMEKFDIPIDLIKLTVDEYENETRMIASYVKEGKVIYSAK